MPELLTDDGVLLHYQERGAGPVPLLYLHSMGGDAQDWAEVWHGLKSARYRHIGLDCRGHGRSQATPCLFTLDRLARDALQIADLLSLERFVVVGHSFGGKVALRIAAMEPKRVSHMILLGGVGPGVVPIDREAVDSILARTREATGVRECFRDWFKRWTPPVQRWCEGFARTPEWAHRAVCEAALWTDATAEVGRVTTPAFVISGEQDPVYGPAYQREQVLPFLQVAQSAFVDCGHGLPLERPVEIAALIRGFLQGNNRRVGGA